ncbi:MAG: hypothetical protein ABI559_05125, partial [Chloroflexota bacterium]
DQAPLVNITNPVDGGFGEEGGLVVLDGAANDYEDGPLTGASLVWKSDIDGALGTSEQLPLNTLSAGVHTITLTATDSDGTSSETSITLTIGVLGNLQYTPAMIDPNSSEDVTGIVTLSPGIPTTDINTTSISLHIGQTVLTPKSVEQLGDTDADGLPELAVTFDGTSFRAAMGDSNGPTHTTLTGEMNDQTAFNARGDAALVIAGDVNCDGSVNGTDITLALGSTIDVSSPDCLYAGDHDCDGDVTAGDVLGTLTHLAGAGSALADSCAAPQAAPAQVVKSDSGGGGGLFSYWWLAAAALPAMVLAGRKRRLF